MALFSFLKRDPSGAFWRWFEKNAAAIAEEVQALRKQNKGGEAVIGSASQAMAGRLKKLHPSLTYELGSEADWPIEVIISADGDVEAFPLVAALVSGAPVIEGFKITAFRPRVGDAYALGMFGKEVTFSQVRYEAWDEDDRMGVKLYIGVTGLEGDELDAMAFILLDMALGEHDVATGLGTIEVAMGRPDNAKRLKDLAAEFDAFHTPTLH